MIPDWMKRKRNSSSSACFLGLITKQTIFSICLIKPTKIHVFARLNVVWNAASTKLNFAALAKKWGVTFGHVFVETNETTDHIDERFEDH